MKQILLVELRFFFFNVPVALVDKSTVKLTDNLNKGNRHLQPLNHLSKHIRQDRAKFCDLGEQTGVTIPEERLSR